MIVADTNVIFHLFNGTELTFLAKKLRAKDSNWIFPRIWQEEFANIISKLARKEKTSINQVISFFLSTLDILQTCERNVSTEEALEFSINNAVSVYDAYFLVLAREYQTVVVTEDREMIRKCPSLALNISSFLNL